LRSKRSDKIGDQSDKHRDVGVSERVRGRRGELVTRRRLHWNVILCIELSVVLKGQEWGMSLYSRADRFREWITHQTGIEF